MGGFSIGTFSGTAASLGGYVVNPAEPWPTANGTFKTYTEGVWDKVNFINEGEYDMRNYVLYKNLREYLILIPLPGFSKEDIEITHINRDGDKTLLVTLKANNFFRIDSINDEKLKYDVSEPIPSDKWVLDEGSSLKVDNLFSFGLNDIDPDSIKSEMNNGLLKITAKRKVEIKEIKVD